MAHYAQLDSENIVVNVFVGRDETDLPAEIDSWEIYYAPQGFTVRRTSYNSYGGSRSDGTVAFRKNYAGIGFTYDENRDAFIPPQPYASWVLDEDTCLWVAPIAYPAEGDHVWDEETGDWVEVTDETV